MGWLISIALVLAFCLGVFIGAGMALHDVRIGRYNPITRKFKY